MNRTYPWMFVGPLLILGAATLEGFWLQRTRGQYDWRAYFTSLGDLGLRIAFRLLPLGLATSALNWLWDHRLYTMPLGSVWPWALLFVGQDFFYYWMHRADHRVRWLWATHSVHHSPNELNLSAAYRLGWTSRLSIAPIFFAPLVLMGFSPIVVGAALALNLLYQFWLHAPWIPRLGPLEWLLNTPAHHRVHHASNPEYLDANFGGVLIVFDRWFGTYREEVADVPIRYGLVYPIRSYNPLLIGMREWISIGRDVWSARGLRAVFASMFGPPRTRSIGPRVTKSLALLCSIVAMSGCGGGSGDSGSPSAAPTTPTATTGTVNLVIQDTPSPKLTVLSFQVQITGAVLQPGNVSILPKPVTVDLTQLVSDTAFLSSTVVGSATFASMTLTFANPQVTIVNNSEASIVTPTQTCRSGAVCTFVPKVNAASVTISSGVFPVTVTANSSTGFALDLSIPDLLQSDLSATFANGTSVNLSLLPTPTNGGAEAQIDDVLGVVQSVSSGQVKITKPDGELLVLTTTSSTVYNYPASVCAANDASCVMTNQLITADLSLLATGALLADSITFADNPGATVAQGVIVSLSTGTPTTCQMLVHRVLPTTTAFTVGDVVDATMQAGAAYSVASDSYPAVTGGTFASETDLMVGQEVLVEVTQQTAPGTDGNAAFTSGMVTLDSSQIFGQVTSVDSSTQSFMLNNVWSLFSSLSPTIPQLQVQTGAPTSFVDLSPANLTAVIVGANARVKGPLFRATTGTSGPTMSALQVSGKP